MIQSGATMPANITMPQLSDTMTEGTLIKWYKKEGDKINAGDKLADVETDKAVMEWEAYDEHEGTLAKVLVNEGQKAKIGEVLAVVATKGEKVEDVAKNAGGNASSAPRTEPSGSAAGSSPAGSSASTSTRPSSGN